MYGIIEINSAFPQVGRAAGRAVIGHLNWLLLNAAVRNLKQERATAREAATIDQYNEETAKLAGDKIASENLEEQGYDPGLERHALLGMLLQIRNRLYEDLYIHAGTTRSLITNKQIKNIYDLGPTFEESLDQQIGMAQDISPARVKMEAAALGLSEAEIIASLKAIEESDRKFLIENRTHILNEVKSWVEFDPDMNLESVEDRLPAINRMRLIAKALQGLQRGIDRAAQRYLKTRSPEAMSDIGLMKGTMKELFKERDDLLGDPAFSKELDAALDAGASYPEFPEQRHEEKAA